MMSIIINKKVQYIKNKSKKNSKVEKDLAK